MGLKLFGYQHSSNIFFCVLHNKELNSIFGPNYGSHWDSKRFGYQHSSKYIFCSTEKINYMRVSKLWQNSHFRYTIPLRSIQREFVFAFKNESQSAEEKKTTKHRDKFDYFLTWITPGVHQMWPQWEAQDESVLSHFWFRKLYNGHKAAVLPEG